MVEQTKNTVGNGLILPKTLYLIFEQPLMAKGYLLFIFKIYLMSFVTRQKKNWRYGILHFLVQTEVVICLRAKQTWKFEA